MFRINRSFDCFRKIPVYVGKCLANNVARNARDFQSSPLPMKRVFLMGSPGSGKTTAATAASLRLDVPSVDVDEYLEKYWQTTVADKLKELGDDGFLSAEGEALFNMDLPEDCIVSLSGSNPMHHEAMQRIHSSGNVIFLDVLHDDVISRLGKMKVDRIVGRSSDFTKNLEHRQQFYEGSYDVRVTCEKGEGKDSITTKVVDAVHRLASAPSGFVSTRSNASDVNQVKGFSEVVLSGAAPDGGLYVLDDCFPYFTVGELSRLSTLDYRDRALRVFERILHPSDIHPSTLRKITKAAFSTDAFDGGDPCRVEQIADGEFILELFRGPTASFKDLSTRLLPLFFQHAAQNSDVCHRQLVLVATSGDTGGAVAHSFAALSDTDDVKVLVLYPQHGVTELQKLQLLASASKSVSIAAVDGDFDDCQKIVKHLLTDRSLRQEMHDEFNTQLGVANSINWGRLLGQILFHISGYLDLLRCSAVKVGQPVDVCIPSGNFGNFMAAFYAKQMGVPIRHLISASNRNNTLSEFINTGHLNIAARGSHAVRTMSPAIDIVRPSNIERLLHLALGRDGHAVQQAYQELDSTGRYLLPSQVRSSIRRLFLADWCSDDACLQTIRDTLHNSGYLVDTHTAVALSVAKKFTQYRGPKVPLLVCATAHYGKCLDEVMQAVTGVPSTAATPSQSLSELQRYLPANCRPKMHSELFRLISSGHSQKAVVLPAKRDAIVAHIRSIL